VTLITDDVINNERGSSTDFPSVVLNQFFISLINFLKKKTKLIKLN
jgi:hypothetical protein